MGRCHLTRVAMKRIIVGLLMFCSLSAMGQHTTFDTLALLIIDRMSAVIGDMRACRFRLTTATDVPDVDNVMIKQFADYEIFLSGADKMLINANGKRGHRQYKYNGKQLALYSFEENNYGVLQTPSTTIETIENLNADYGIDFPAADFLYPALTDDLLQNSDLIRYLGIETIDDKQFYHVLASNNETDMQFWISNDESNLPSRFVITDKLKEGNPQYYACFSAWEINPELPSALFDFLPPPGASHVKIISRNEQ
jgi:hypothetical protein